MLASLAEALRSLVDFFRRDYSQEAKDVLSLLDRLDWRLADEQPKYSTLILASAGESKVSADYWPWGVDGAFVVISLNDNPLKPPLRWLEERAVLAKVRAIISRLKALREAERDRQFVVDCDLRRAALRELVSNLEG